MTDAKLTKDINKLATQYVEYRRLGAKLSFTDYVRQQVKNSKLSKKYKKNKLLGSTMKYRMEFLLQIMTGSMKELVYLFENEGKENTNENIGENISDSDKVSISDDSDSSVEVNTTNNYLKKETEFVNQSERMNKKIKRTTNTDDVEDRKKNYYNNSAINYNKSNQYNF